MGLVAVLVCLIGIAIYVDTAPLREERALRHASIAELEQDLTQDPSDERALYYLGLRDMQDNDLAAAMAAFQHAALLAPRDEEVAVGWSQAAEAAHGFQAGRVVLASYLRQFPRSALLHLELAKQCFAAKDYSESYAEAQTATKLGPNNAEAWRWLAVTAMKNEYPEIALPAVDHAITLSPKNAEYHYLRGAAYYEMRRYDDALTSYRQAVDLAPGDPSLNLGLARTLVKTASGPADLETARAMAQKALAQPKSLTPLGIFQLDMCIGESYEQEGQWAQALPWLQQAERIQPKTPGLGDESHHDLARVYHFLNNQPLADRELALHERYVQFGTARMALLAKLQAKPDDLQAELTLARLYAANGDVPDAEQSYSQILSAAPRNSSALHELRALASHTGRP